MYKELQQIRGSRITRKILFILLLTLLSIPFYIHAQRLTSSNIIEKNTEELNDIVFEIDNIIDKKTILLDQLIKDTRIESLLRDESSIDSTLIESLIESARRRSDSDIVYVMDTAGTVIASTIYDGSKSLKGNNYAFRDYFTDALKGGIVVFPAVGVTTKTRGLYLSSRIYDMDQGKVLGVLVFKVGLQDIDELLSKYDSPKMYASKQGIVFASNDKDTLFKAIKPLSQRIIRKIERSKQFADNKITVLNFPVDSGEVAFKENQFVVRAKTTSVMGWEVFSLKKKGLGLFLTGYQIRLYILVFCLFAIVLFFSVFIHVFDSQEFSSSKIRNKIIVPVGIVLLLICFSSIWFNSQYYKSDLENSYRMSLEEVESEFDISIKEEAGVLESYIDLIEKNDGVRNAFLTKDRHLLYSFSKQIFDELNNSFQITHLYFHDLQRKNYLRVHSPLKHGDYVNRFTLSEAYRRGVASHGIELGPYGRFALRVVRPWFHNGKLIGYIELAKDIERILPSIAEVENVDLVSVVRKDLLNKNEFLEGQHLFNQIVSWDKYPEHILTGSTIKDSKEMQDEITKMLADPDIKYFSKILKLVLGEKQYLSSAISLQDVKKRDVGNIIVLKDISFEEIAFRKLVFQIIEIELVALIFLGLFLWLFLGRIERGILRTTANLEANVTDLQMVSTILLDNEASLEREVLYRKNIQKDLISAKEHAELLSKVVPSAIFTVDTNKKVTSWNDYIEKLTGYSKEEVIGKECVFFAQSPCSDLCGLFESDISKPIISKECAISCKDGTILKVSKNVDYLRNNDGEIIGGIECFEDITDRIEQQKKISKANKELEDSLSISESLREDLEEAQIQTKKAAQIKADFLANMSHEMRTPMNAILGFSDLLKLTNLDEQQKAYVETVSSSGDLLIRIINDILDFSKLDSGMISLENVDFNLQYLLNDVFKIAVYRTKKSSVEVFIDIDKDVSFNLRGDPTRLRQIFLNLLSNAIKFTEQGSIGVLVKKDDSLSEDRQTLRFIVKDTGIGVPEDKKESIFESFAQADTSTTRKYGGTGLGLTICRSIVEAMGGEIWVESIEGKGSEFIFILDFEIGQPVARENVFPVKKVDLHKQKVAILDDNEAARKIHVKCCESLGMEIISVEGNPLEALKNLKQLEMEGQVADLVLCDLVMDEMDGDDFAQELRKMSSYKKVKMIAITAEPEIGGANDAEKMGFDGYMPKPVTLEELKSVIRTVFGDNRVERTIVTRHMAKELSCEGAKILVVEDSVTNQMLIKEYFNQLGCVGEYALNGQEALDILSAGKKFDLILMDIQMTGMSGIQATEIIRREVDPDIPIIALTAAVLEEDREKADKAGMNDFVPKPVNLETLKDIIAKYRE